MPSRFDLITINASDTDAIASFWTAALGLHETEREDVDRWVVLSSADGVRRIGIQRGASRAGTIHLDLACDPVEFAAELERLLELGAVEVLSPRHESYGSIVNLADPEGNLFDLCAYR